MDGWFVDCVLVEGLGLSRNRRMAGSEAEAFVPNQSAQGEDACGSQVVRSKHRLLLLQTVDNVNSMLWRLYWIK